MATRSGLAELVVESDIAFLYETLCPIQRKYKAFALQINVIKSKIETIEAQYRDHGDRLLEILTASVRQVPGLTWACINKALRSQSVGENEIAEKILEHCKPGPCLETALNPRRQAFECTPCTVMGKEQDKCLYEDIQTKRPKLCIESDYFTDMALKVDKGMEELSSSQRDSIKLSSFENEPAMENKRKKRKSVESSPSSVKIKRESLRLEVKESSPSSSGDESSLLEFDNNMLRSPSKSDKKCLVQVFKRSFGKLCCAIKNPVEIAAQLQGKGILSFKTMESLLTSPETEQVKTITLVHTLKEVVEKKPDGIFAIINVLLNNQFLREVGKEMFIEAGKVCPARMAYFLGSEVPPEISTVPSDKKIEFQMMPVTLESEHACTSSSLKLGQHLPPASPVLMQYKQYLKSYYKARSVAPADKYLPTLMVPFINLAMVSRDSSDLERDEFTKQTLHGGVDQILFKKSPIAIEALMNPEVSEEPVRFILVEGPPGIGKSTFAWEVCRRWDDIENLRLFKIVLLLRLREKWVLRALSFSDMFRYEDNPELNKSISKELAKTQGRNLLLVLDGFDEVSHSFHEHSIIQKLLCKQILPECTIILTTRPSAIHRLKIFCQPQVDKHIEIVGFTEEQRVEYITKAFSKKPELQVNFLKHIFHVPYVKSLMYSPLNCAIIAQVYNESHSSQQLLIPRTRTQLFKALSHSLLVRHACADKCEYQYTSLLPENLTSEDMKKFKILARFAFNTYHNVQIRKITFFEEDIPEGFVHFGFMNESTEMYASRGFERVFSFLHLSLQEYLAAWHIANSHSIEFQIAYHKLVVDAYDVAVQAPTLPLGRYPTQYYCSNEAEEALRVYLQPYGYILLEPAIFLAGITGWEHISNGVNHWEEYLIHHTLYLHPKALLPFLFEAQNPTIFEKYFCAKPIHFSRSEATVDLSLTHYECYALSYCLAHCRNEVELEVCITDESIVSLLEVFVKGTEDHFEYITPKIYKLTIIAMIDSVETLKNCAVWLKKARFFNGIKEMSFLFQNLELDWAQEFFSLLVKLHTLKISFKSLTSWEWLSSVKLLRELKLLELKTTHDLLFTAKPAPLPPASLLSWPLEHGLQGLVLNVEFSTSAVYAVCTPVDRLMKSVSKSALMSNEITALVLPHISRATMSGIRNILLQCPSLQYLQLYKTRLGCDGILFICSALRKNTALKELSINDLQNTKVLLGPLDFASFTTMEKVNLPSRMTSTDFLLELDNILKDNTTLEIVNIQSEFLFPLSGSGYCEWTGIGPLQQFNVGAISSGRCACLKRSFSSSDLTKSQPKLFWDKNLISKHHHPNFEVNFTNFFSVRKKQGKKLFSLPSFTAPDYEVLQSFSSLDHRLKTILNISDLNQYLDIINGGHWVNYG